MQQCRTYLCIPVLSCAALLLPSHTHLIDELAPKLLPVTIIDPNIGKAKCGPGLFNKNLQTARGLPLCLSLLLCSGQGCLCQGGGRPLPWVLCPQDSYSHEMSWTALCWSSYTAMERIACPSTTAKHRACSTELGLG